jgi:16S rRNA (cytidine1402-2'-O)-methyltransferase
MVQYSQVPGVLAGQSGTLYVVATPIGNLEDITLRALRVLKDTDVIAAEDTRRTAKLLAHHTIDTQLISFHAHNARAQTPRLVARLGGGESVALVTDAGTPGISDPGVELVQAAIKGSIPVDPVPGASAPLAALVASGFPMEPITLLGFPPYRSNSRINWLKDLSMINGTLVFFESPHRIRKMLTEASIVFGNRPIVLARELTKIHQEFLRGSFYSVLQQLAEVRGEFTIVVGPLPEPVSSNAEPPDDADLAKEFYRMTKNGSVSRRSAVASVARLFGCSSRHVYAAVERAKDATGPHGT